MSRGLVMLVLVLAPSCVTTFSIQDAHFRAPEPGAFDRAVKALDESCGGVRALEAGAQLAFSKWQAWHTPDGYFLSRCLVALAPVPDEKESDVRVTMALRVCEKSEFEDLEVQAEFCAFTDIVPGVVAEKLVEAGKKIEAAVRR